MTGLRNGLNFNEDLGSLMFDQALIANPEENATWFDLYVSSSIRQHHTRLINLQRSIEPPQCSRARCQSQVCASGQVEYVRHAKAIVVVPTPSSATIMSSTRLSSMNQESTGSGPSSMLPCLVTARSVPLLHKQYCVVC